MSRVKERLEKETALHLEARQKISLLEDRAGDLEHRLSCEERERRRLESLLTEGSLPDDAKVINRYALIYKFMLNFLLLF